MPYLVVEGNEKALVLAVAPMVAALADKYIVGEPRADLARAFHATLAEASADVAGEVRRKTELNRVVRSGGVFQNRLVSEDLAAALLRRGFEVYGHRLVSRMIVACLWDRPLLVVGASYLRHLAAVLEESPCAS